MKQFFEKFLLLLSKYQKCMPAERLELFCGIWNKRRRLPMAQSEKHYNLHELLEEIRASEGLPENLSTEAQLWDEIMKKETFLMPEQLFPLIKEVHKKTYPRGTEIYPLATEFSVERLRTKEIASIRADITVIVAKKDIYHFECQMNNDGTMVLRMFEYDVHLALSYIQENESGMELKFPYSAVLYLQDNGNIPKKLTCRVRFQDGEIYEYKVPVVKVQDYTLEEIKEKHLCVLIPFLPLRFRKTLKKLQKQAESEIKEELTSFYQQIIVLLEEEVEAGYLSNTNRNTIISLLSKSMIRVFYRNEELLKEVVAMTEPILELEFEKYEKVIAAQEKRLQENERHLQESEKCLQEKDAQIAELKRQLEEMRR